MQEVKKEKGALADECLHVRGKRKNSTPGALGRRRKRSAWSNDERRERDEERRRSEAATMRPEH